MIWEASINIYIYIRKIASTSKYNSGSFSVADIGV